MTLSNYACHQIEFLFYIIDKYPGLNHDDLHENNAIDFDVWKDFAKFPKLKSVNDGMFVAHGYQTYYIYNQKTNQLFYSESISINPMERLNIKIENDFLSKKIDHWKSLAAVPWI